MEGSQALMPVGSKWRLYIHMISLMALPTIDPIKPFLNLIFDVELLGIEK